MTNKGEENSDTQVAELGGFPLLVSVAKNGIVAGRAELILREREKADKREFRRALSWLHSASGTPKDDPH